MNDLVHKRSAKVRPVTLTDGRNTEKDAKEELRMSRDTGIVPQSGVVEIGEVKSGEAGTICQGLKVTGESGRQAQLLEQTIGSVQCRRTIKVIERALWGWLAGS